jgi:hypothetical protein
MVAITVARLDHQLPIVIRSKTNSAHASLLLYIVVLVVVGTICLTRQNIGVNIANILKWIRIYHLLSFQIYGDCLVFYFLW